jgi:hypothetical protein
VGRWRARSLCLGSRQPRGDLGRRRMSIAYVFVHMMPELHIVRRALTASISIRLWYEGTVTHFLALLGFLAFYGLDHLHARRRETAVDGPATPDFRFHVVGFAAYVSLKRFLLIDNLRESNTSTALYAMAMPLHFFWPLTTSFFTNTAPFTTGSASACLWECGSQDGRRRWWPAYHSALALFGGFPLEYDHYELCDYGTSI